jgi:predicted O-linked N-acetylglucosamine transferase (SPINDLY family)
MSGDPALDSALRLRRAGRLAEAAEIYSQILRANPKHFEALHALGILRYQSGQIDEAERLIGAAIAVQPHAAEAIYNRACLLLKLGRIDDAVVSFGQAIAVRPDYVEALTNRGSALMQLERYAEARADFDAVVALAPKLAQTWNNRGSAATKQRSFAEALESFDRALALRPDYAEAWRNRGTVFLVQGLPQKALADFDKAVALDPRSAEAWEYRGNALSRSHPMDAVASYDRALLIRPDHAETIFRRANAYLSLRRFDEAAADYERVLALDPDCRYALGNAILCALHRCDWAALDQRLELGLRGLRDGKRVFAPFAAVAAASAAGDLLQASRTWVMDECAAVDPPLWRGQNRTHDRIRIAYLSADLHSHATARLMAGVFEHHDKKRFETIAISFGPDDGSEMRTRLTRGFEHFLDVRQMSDDAVAQVLLEREIDIAVDLKGFTEHSRPGILARRPAPIQVNYLGFPGTMAAEYIAYIVADRTVVPEEHQGHYAEKTCYLPHSYQCNDASRQIAVETPSRAAVGLPGTGFVFCAFNNVYKITPEMFAIWMRLLKAVDGGVLWLLQSGGTATRNLRREAEARGVPPDRLVFAPSAPPAAHLARMRLADLFLDTLPCGAHTTASDALWAGLPVLTCLGETFAGRVAASLLHAVGLPELVTRSPAQYEERALELARDGSCLAELKAKLAAHRLTYPLFNTVLFTRNLESAYARMWDNHRAGRPPESFG